MTFQKEESTDSWECVSREVTESGWSGIESKDLFTWWKKTDNGGGWGFQMSIIGAILWAILFYHYNMYYYFMFYLSEVTFKFCFIQNFIIH